MPRELIALGPRKLILREYEEKELQADEIRIRTEFSSPKHGTESHIYRGTSPTHKKMFDPHYRLFLPRETTGSPFPRPLGNMSTGTVIEAGAKVKKFKAGDKVLGHLPIRETFTVKENQISHLPAGMSSEEAVCLDPAYVALAGIRDANIRLGERVAIFGLGAIGLMSAQMAKLSGATTVFASDPLPIRRRLAEEYGADRTFDPTGVDVGLEIKKASEDKGVDVAIEISGSYGALQDAIRSVHYCGRVVTVSFYQGSGSALRLSEEWHHNRITMLSSMPVWENPSRNYPMWDAERLEETAFALMQTKKLTAEGLIAPVYPFEKSVEAYELIDKHPEKCIKLGITY